jgi:hypothetical protein
MPSHLGMPSPCGHRGVVRSSLSRRAVATASAATVAAAAPGAARGAIGPKPKIRIGSRRRLRAFAAAAATRGVRVSSLPRKAPPSAVLRRLNGIPSARILRGRFNEMCCHPQTCEPAIDQRALTTELHTVLNVNHCSGCQQDWTSGSFLFFFRPSSGWPTGRTATSCVSIAHRQTGIGADGACFIHCCGLRQLHFRGLLVSFCLALTFVSS